MKESEKIKVLANVLLDLSKLDISTPDYINKVLNALTDCFKADFCIWHHTKNRRDFLTFSDYDLANFQRIRVVTLNNKQGEEALMIVNPKIEPELEAFIIGEIREILENISNCDFFVSDLKMEMFTDGLTKLNNYDSFKNRILSRNQFEKVCVCFIDVNGLGMVNNLYGHEAGDKMLVAVADAMRSCFRSTDIFRKSGDEFIIVCEGVKEEIIHERLASMRLMLDKDGYSVSCGVAYCDHSNNIEELVNLADTLMYIEKEKYRSENPSKYLVMQNKDKQSSNV